MQNISSAAFTDTKPHYDLLDGLRGVAALLVVWYHVYEGYAFAGGSDTIGGINHGYLARGFLFYPIRFRYRLCLRRPLGKEFNPERFL